MTGCNRTHVIKQLVLMMIDVVLVQTFSHVLTTSTTTVPTPTTSTCPEMPLSCVVQLTGCTCYCNTINCVDLGVLNTVPSVFSDLHIANHSIILSISGQTKVLSIQARAFNGSNIQSIQLGRLGIKTIDPSAFTGLSNVVNIYLNGNGVSLINPGTFWFVRSTSGPLSLIDLSSNEIDSISNSSFVGIIYDINLSGNRLRQLPDYVFSNVSSLTSLNLSSNRLSNLSSNVFFGLQSIVNLTISRNSISYIDKNAFRSLSSLQRLDLSENLITSFDRVQLSSTLTYLNLRGNRLTMFSWPSSWSGSSPTIKLRVDRNKLNNLTKMSVCTTNVVLTSLSITGNIIDKIPDNYFTGCQQMSTLDLSVNNITGISPSTFTGLKSLVYLDASSNNIDDLPPGSLAELKKLKYLNLADNRLSTLHYELFQNCIALETVILARNQIYDIEAFNVLVNLIYLDLSSNTVELKSQSFANFSELQFLNLSHNSISSFDLSTFNALTDIDLSFNQLQDSSLDFPTLQSLNLTGNNLDATTFQFTLSCNATIVIQLNTKSIENLTEVNVKFSGCSPDPAGYGSVVLSGNGIKTIAPQTFLNSASVFALDLSNNNLSTIDRESFVGLSQLRLLDLSDNSLISIQDGSFKNVPQLKELRLGRNKLTLLTTTTFNGLVGSLAVLEVSDNFLGDQFFHQTFLTQMKQLQVLKADGIGVSAMNGGLLPWTTLTTLSLRRNSITRIAGVKSSTLKQLDLGENYIGADFLSNDLSSFRLLETLTLDSNNLTSIAFQGAPQVTYNIQVLTLDGNQIQSLSGAESVQRSLRDLSVMNNQLGDDSWTVISSLSALQELRLDGNQLKTIPAYIFSTMFDLQTVSLSLNSLTYINESTLDGLERSCTTLNLSNNAISSVDQNALTRLSNLNVIDLSSNSISSLVFPPTLDSLRDLRLDGNQLVAFPDGPIQFRSLQSFSVSRNKLTSLPELEIYNSANADGFVWTIDLSNNQLNNSFDLFCLVGSFLVVDLRANGLTNVIGCFDRVVNIGVLILANNKLGDAALSAAGLFHQLTTFVSVLYLDDNSLTSLSTFRTSTSTTTIITRLSLTRNQISVLDDTFFPSISESISELDLRQNQLYRLNESVFSLSTTTTTIQLSLNPWRCDCSLVWIRNSSIVRLADDAVCWTPQATVGQSILCYDVPADCNIDTISLAAVDNERCSPTNGTEVPIVNTISPLFGPVAGGTDVTITGQWPQMTPANVVLFPVDGLHYYVIFLSSLTFDGDSLVAVTPPDVSDKQPVDAPPKHLAVNIMFDGGPTAFSNQYFDFRPNAVITGVSPTDHLTTGGTFVTVMGTNLDCAAVPKIQITVDMTLYPTQADSSGGASSTVPQQSKQTVTTNCTINVTNTAITCPMPPVPLVLSYWLINGTSDNVSMAEAGSSATQILGLNGLDTAIIRVGMIFDGFRDYGDFSNSLPQVQLNFFLPPTIINLNVIDFNPLQQTDLQLLGKNLQHDVQLADYLVTIGSEQCVINNLTSNAIYCQPPFDEPALNANNDQRCTKMQLNAVMVRIRTEWQFCACIRYVKNSPNIGLIVGLSVGLGLIFVVIVIVIFVVVIRRQQSRTKSNKSSSPQMAPQDPETSQYFEFQLPGDSTAIDDWLRDRDANNKGINNMAAVRTLTKLHERELPAAGNNPGSVEGDTPQVRGTLVGTRRGTLRDALSGGSTSDDATQATLSRHPAGHRLTHHNTTYHPFEMFVPDQNIDTSI